LVVGSASVVGGVAVVHGVEVGRRIVVIQFASVVGSPEVVHEASGVGSIEVALTSVVGNIGVALASMIESVGVVVARSSTMRAVVRDSLHINCREIVTGRTWRR
jgi:hypothetical protein